MAPANVLLKRRHAASDNKTNIQVSIFPDFRSYFKKRCDRTFSRNRFGTA
jgi:hypothetical protein